VSGTDFTEGPRGTTWGTTKSWTCSDLLTIVSLPCNNEHPDLESIPQTDYEELMLNDKMTARMFTNISWGNYIVVVVLLLASWYLFIGLRFYFDDLKDIVTRKRKLQFRRLGNTNYQDSQSELNDQDSAEAVSPGSSFGEFDTTFQEVDALVERLKSFIANADKRKVLKQEFIEYIRLILREYPSVKKSPFSSSVSELIVSECDKLESVTLTQMEAEELWN
jgi:hypothetical protein